MKRACVLGIEEMDDPMDFDLTDNDLEEMDNHAMQIIWLF